MNSEKKPLTIDESGIAMLGFGDSQMQTAGALKPTGVVCTRLIPADRRRWRNGIKSLMATCCQSPLSIRRSGHLRTIGSVLVNNDPNTPYRLDEFFYGG